MLRVESRALSIEICYSASVLNFCNRPFRSGGSLPKPEFCNTKLLVESNEPRAHANPAAAGNPEAAMPDSGQWVVAGLTTFVDDANSNKSVSKKGQ
jgi:hypothetical protein